MKKRTTITIDEALYNTANNNRDNFSRYVERLIERDLAESFREPIVKAVKKELMADNAFFSELASRLGTPTRPTESPSKPQSSDDAPELVEYSIVFTNTGEVLAKYLDKESADNHITKAIENGGLEDEFKISERVLK